MSMCFYLQVDHKSSLEWFLPRVIWIYSQTSFRCITQWWKSSSWAHPLEQCTWCILSSKPHMIPTMTRSGKIKYFVKWTNQLLYVKTLFSQKFCQNLILGFSQRIEFLLGPCALLALVLNHEFSVMEILWTFSIYLESVAILPQLFMVQKTGEAESITSHYLFALGSYRGLYILNWIYRYYSEGKLLNDLLYFVQNSVKSYA